MNGVLLSTDSDVISEIKEIVKNIEQVKATTDMYSEIIKRQISFDSV